MWPIFSESSFTGLAHANKDDSRGNTRRTYSNPETQHEACAPLGPGAWRRIKLVRVSAIAVAGTSVVQFQPTAIVNTTLYGSRTEPRRAQLPVAAGKS